jgi:hypothetical protein
MTTLGAIKVDDQNIVFVSDTREVNNDDYGWSWDLTTKIKCRLNGLPHVAYGFAGHVGLGDEFVSTLESESGIAGWDDLEHRAATAVRMCNREGRRRNNSGEIITTMFAGFIGAEGRIVTVNHGGMIEDSPTDARFVGSVAKAAYEVWPSIKPNHNLETVDGAREALFDTYQALVNRYRALSIGPPWEPWLLTPDKPPGVMDGYQWLPIVDRPVATSARVAPG